MKGTIGLWKILLSITIAVAFGWLGYHVFFGEEARAYLSTDPWSLLWIALIAVGGGLLSMVIQRCSPASRRRGLLVVRAMLVVAYGLVFLVILRGSSGWGPRLIAIGLLGLMLLQLHATWKSVWPRS